MSFSSAEYPLFLLAVFFLYGYLRAGGRWALLLRLGVLLLLFDLTYLLWCKDLGRLWDPLGAAVLRLLAPPSARPPWRAPDAYALGVAVLALGVFAGLRRGAALASDWGEARLALAAAGVVGLLGVMVIGASHNGRLALLSADLAAVGHLVGLLLFGVAVGAAQREPSAGLGRMLLLFLVSAFFYHAWAAGMPGAYKYLLLLIVGTIVLDYYLALWIDDTASPGRRRALLIVSLVSNLGVLCVFKYCDFFLGAVHDGAALWGVHVPRVALSLILPAGISFHTFQSLSYTIDVYRREVPATRSLVRFATYVLFFPQLVAGPIVRAREFLPQLGREPAIDPAQASQGLLRIVYGLFKKLALADLLALTLVDRVFAHPGRFSSLEVAAAVYGYAFQIYLDFSAYSDIAIGSAALLGFTFPENFDAPYRSTTLQAFWRRWHITLSTWLRDYLYIPLGGSRGGPFRTYRNLLLTMLLGGLWHGANWTFLVWGGLHGGGLLLLRRSEELRKGGSPIVGWALVGLGLGATSHTLLSPGLDALAVCLHIDRAWPHLVLAWLYAAPAWAALCTRWTADPQPGGLRAALGRALALLLTFHYVCLGWIFFRAPSFATAREVLIQLGAGGLDALNVSPRFLWALGLAAATHAIPDRAVRALREGFVALPPLGQALLLFAAALVLRRLATPAAVPFIYFQF